ncbi:extracellular solute-binding protein [Paenibacillus mesophilus]|uniref:extracellular solute-binding protein n=1 Tax=Paenibacillus mesophilus TaxID=2582849 RepID=UPI0013052428|nr:extracellular solute-binding protein [Paenibacillus mesophilus]
MKVRPTNEQFREKLEQVKVALRSEIIDGKYAPGEFLPSEASLAEAFGMSNRSLRKGLDLLVEEGWIEKIPGVGNKVLTRQTRVVLKLVCNQVTHRNLLLSELLSRFQAQYPWISVETELYSEIPGPDSVKKIDLVMIDNFQFLQAIESGGAEKLEPLPVHTGIFSAVSRPFFYEGLPYMQPIIFSPIVLCYNKAHFRENGLQEPNGSWTWNDLVQSAELLTNGNGRYGFCFHGPGINRWPVFLLQSGERFEWSGRKPNSLRGTKLLESLKLFRSIIENRNMFPLYWSEDSREINQMFLEGRLSMTLNSYMGFNQWMDADPDAIPDFDISPVPFIDEPRTLVIALGLGIVRHTPYMEEAKLFLDFMTSFGTQQFIRDETVSIPSLQAVHSTIAPSSMQRPNRYPLFREMLFSYRSYSDLNIPASAFSKLYNHFKAYWANIIDEDELCARIDKTRFGETDVRQSIGT